MPGVVPGPGVPAGRVGGVVVVEDGGGVGQGEAHDPHRSSSDRLVSGRAMTVRSGAPVLHCAYRSATGPAVGLDGTVRGEGDDVGCHRRGGVAEQQHVGEPLPGLLDGAGQRDAALRMVAGVVNPASRSLPVTHTRDRDARRGVGARCLGCLGVGVRVRRPAAMLIGREPSRLSPYRAAVCAGGAGFTRPRCPTPSGRDRRRACEGEAVGIAWQGWDRVAGDQISHRPGALAVPVVVL